MQKIRYHIFLLLFFLINTALHAQYDVEWTNFVNTTLTGDVLEKTGGVAGFNANANSANILVGDGWVKYKVTSNNTSRLFGFSEYGTPIVSDKEILYGFYTNVSNLLAREAGVQVVLNTLYAIGDELLLEKVGNTIYYKKNGVVLRELEIDESLVLNAGVVMSTVGSKFEGITTSFGTGLPVVDATVNHVSLGENTGSINVTQVGGTGPYTYSWSPGGETTKDLTGISKGTYTLTITDATSSTYEETYDVNYKANWINLTNVTLTGDVLEKTGGVAGFNASANSTNILVGDGWVRYNVKSHTTISNNLLRIIGFSEYDENIVSDVEILYGFYTNGANLLAREGGVQVVLNSSYAIGDELLLEKIGSIIYYKKNGVILRKVGVDESLVLNAGVVLHTVGSKFEGITTSFGSDIPLFATASWNHVLSGTNTGTIDITPEGGVAPYTYSWSNGSTTQNLSNLSIGDYTVTITDAASNTYTKTISIGYGVEWTDFLGTAASENTLEVIVTYGGWNKGAASTNLLKSNKDGWVEYTVLENDKYRTIGLSTYPNASANLPEINYGFQIRADGDLYIYELNNPIVQGIAYNLGDVLKIERTGSFINYYQNGELIREVATDATDQLIIDASFGSSGAKFENVSSSFPTLPRLSFNVTQVSDDNSVLGTIDLTVEKGVAPYTYLWQPGGMTTEDLSGLNANTYSVLVTDATGSTVEGAVGLGYAVEWSNLVNATIANGIIKKAGAAGAGAISTTSLPAEVDGWVEYTVGATDNYRFFGLGKGNTSYYFSTIDYCFQLRADGLTTIYELGIPRMTISNYSTEDVFRVERVGSEIRYLINGEIVRTVDTDPQLVLYGDISLHTAGAQFENIRYLFSEPVLLCDYTNYSGTFTIGGDNPDYNTISEALSGLRCKNLTGVVNYIVRGGTYSEGINLSEDILIRRSESDLPINFLVEEGAEVILGGDNTVISINNQEYINLIGFMINPTTDVAIEINNSNNIALSSLILDHKTGGEIAITIQNSDDISLVNSSIVNYDYGINSQLGKNHLFLANQITTKNEPVIISEGVENIRIDQNKITSFASEATIFLKGGSGTQIVLSNTINNEGTGKGLRIEGQADQTLIGANVITTQNAEGVYVNCIKGKLEITDNNISNSTVGVLLGSNESCITDNRPLVYVNQNQIKGSDIGISLQEENSREYVFRNNEIEASITGFHITDLDNTTNIGLVGNLVISDQKGLRLVDTDANIQLRFNTIITNGSTNTRTVEIENASNIAFCSNLMVNKSGNDVVYFGGNFPTSFTSNNNNYYSETSSTISNSEGLMLGITDKKLDPIFNEDDFSLSTRSPLLNDSLPCQDTLTLRDLRGNLRSGLIDVGAIETENTAADGIDIEFILENGISFTPAARVYNQFEIQGLDNFSEIVLNIFSPDNTLVYNSTSSSSFWQGIDVNTNQLVDPGVYIYNLTVDGQQLSGIVVVNE